MDSIKVKGVSFAYPKSEYSVIDDATFSIAKGELCLLIGESAVGKSTLIKLLKKEIAPFGTLDGEICVDGSVGYVAQNVDETIVSDKVRSELSFGLTNMGMSGDEIELLVAEAASYFNLESKLDMPISSLSGGEKQMVNLASVMIMKPSVLLLDEPTSQLDPVSASRFINMIVRLHHDFGTTILIAEHNLDALIYSVDSILYMSTDASIKKDTTSTMAQYLAKKDKEMAKLFPLEMRLFGAPLSYEECKNRIQSASLNTPKMDGTLPQAALEGKNIFFAYNRGEDVLNGASIKIYEGCINAILGPNSSGKSTLLKVLSGVKKQYRGKVKCDKSIAYLCQNVSDLFTKEKCRDEVKRDKFSMMLGVEQFVDQHPFDLSGGQAQRLAIVKVLQTDADIILFDEPTKGLDPVLKQTLAKIMRVMCTMGKTVVLVSHDIEFVGEYADYASFLSRGKIITTLPRREFFSSLSFYTTQMSRLTHGVHNGIVSVDDFVQCGGAL